jgi:plasmid stabilization system protein ParE
VDHRILYTRRALKDLAEIIGVIAGDNAEAAARFGSALLDHVGLLERFPQMGVAVQGGSPVAAAGGW